MHKFINYFLLILLVQILCATSLLAQGQDSIYARHIVNQLASKKFHGRGYTNNGMQKAAAFLQKEFKQIGLQSFENVQMLHATSVQDAIYLQHFNYPVNTFPGKMKAAINEKTLTAGEDFLVRPDSKGLQANASLKQLDSSLFINDDTTIIIRLQDKLTWTVATKQNNTTTILLKKNNIVQTPTNIKLHIENKFISQFNTSNVCGYVKGTKYPDSIIYITAHYDHLGSMGKKTYFPGANDNASGVSLLLTLAKYYQANPQPYSIGFICFAGEEAGLIGSKYFTDYPLHPLRQIKFLINLDLVGTGNEGITVVNASVYPKEFESLKTLNTKHQYLYQIKERGKAQNSDHYWFSEKDVPAFFIYTMGGIGAYHDIYDRAETLPLTAFNNLSALLKDFIKRLQE